MGNVRVDKLICVFPNQKPWMTSQVRTLLKVRNAAFRSGDREQYSAARADLRRGIKKAKADYRRRIEDHLSENNPRQVWQGIQQLTNYSGRNTTTVNSSISLAEKLNSFFARFETSRTSPQLHHHPSPHQLTAPTH